MRRIPSLICILVSAQAILAGCQSADPIPETSSVESADSGPWAPPLSGFTWRAQFNAVNTSAPGNSSCFGKPLAQLVHTAEDWGSSPNTPVRAIGAGTVLYNGAGIWYPGAVIVIRHDLSPSETAALGLGVSTIYSQYGHLQGVLVGVNQQVAAGQQIASVLDQSAVNNTHLHWEVRTVAVPQLCLLNYAGPGYTNSGTDARNWGYLSPSGSVTALASAPARCDNNVAVGDTACNPADPGAEFVCTNPRLPSSQQWTRRGCPSGQSCAGTHCQPGGGGGTCSCSGGATIWGTPVPASDTSCGFQVCGSDNQRYTCANDGWHGAGNSPCNCRCFNGADSQGRPINPNYTYCGYTVCGTDHQHYVCSAGGAWAPQHDSCN